MDYPAGAVAANLRLCHAAPLAGADSCARGALADMRTVDDAGQGEPQVSRCERPLQRSLGRPDSCVCEKHRVERGRFLCKY